MLALPTDPGRLRVVTQLDVARHDVDEAIERIADLPRAELSLRAAAGTQG